MSAIASIGGLRLAVNLSYLRPAVGGSYVYTLAILRSLGRRPDVELVLFGNRTTPPGLDQVPATTLAVPGHGLVAPAGHQIARLWVETIGSRLVDDLRSVDAIWSPGNTAVSLGRRGPKQLITIHDLIHTTEHNPLGGLDTRRRTAALGRAVSRAHRLLVPSRFVADQVASVHGVDPSRIVVTGEGVDLSDRRPSGLDVPADYLICPSTDHRHKQHLLLFEALVAADLNDRDTSLVLTGFRYRGDRHLTEMATRAGLRPDRVVDLGHVDDHGAVLDLMAKARAVVLPSSFEGWGLPALEALALGRPTLAHAVGGVPEFAGPGLVTPDFGSIDSWAHHLRSVLDDPGPSTRAAEADADRILSTFTWDAVADRVLEAALAN